MKARTHGLGLALIAALVSGFAVFVNGYGVRAWTATTDATTYTTVKNVVAAIILFVLALATSRGRRPMQALSSTVRWPLLFVAVLGGAVAFVLFFEGLAAATSSQAAFIHKTLIVWVAIMAPLVLGERRRWFHGLAIVLLVVGQVIMTGGLSGFSWGRGEWLILAATLLWSGEVVLAKRLLSEIDPRDLAVVRMGGGAAVLLVWGLVRGGLATIDLITAQQWGWVLLTGCVLAGYVATWFTALAHAPAIDVTAVLVGGAVVTALLQSGFSAVPLPSPIGLVLVAVGALMLPLLARRTA